MIEKILENDYASAGLETLTTWFFATLFPILIVWFVGAVSGESGYQSLHGLRLSVSHVFVSSEIFVYVTAILAPTLTFMFFQWRARLYVSQYNLLTVFIFLTLFLTAIIYALEKTGAQTDKPFVSLLSVIFYCGSIALWYYSKVIQKKIESITGRSKKTPSGAGIEL